MNWYKTARYNSQIAYLRDHLRSGFDPYDYYDHVDDFLRETGQSTIEESHSDDNWADRYEYSEQWLGSATPEQLKAFEKWIDEKGFTDEFPSDAPAYVHMSYEKMIKPTWLVHFTNENPKDISIEGFTKGWEEFRGLGLTTWHGKERRSPGYNFSFLATSRDAARAARTQKYGKNAVIFWGAGVEAYHYGDEEHQIIVWGPSINSNLMFPIYSDGGDWMVESPDGRRLIEGRDFKEVSQWVTQNWQMLLNIKQKSEGRKLF